MEGTPNQQEIDQVDPAFRDGAPAAGIALEIRPQLAGNHEEPEHPGTPASAARAASCGRRQNSAEFPAILAKASQEQLHEHFLEEYAPVGPTEIELVRMLARHAAGSERWELGAGAVGRQTARHLPELLQGTGGGRVFTSEFTGELTDDVILAGTLVNEAVDRCERHTMRRSRTFLRTLDMLTALQAVRRQRETRGGIMPPLGFPDEDACEQYLFARLARGLVPCPNCDATAGWMLESRKRRECRECQHQIGLRANTVMAHSPVSLRQWFDAIRLLLWQPTIDARELGAQLGVPRLATVRSMQTKIREALASEHASELLAGLDRHFALQSST